MKKLLAILSLTVVGFLVLLTPTPAQVVTSNSTFNGLFPNGAVGTPSISFQNDPDTGFIYAQSSNAFELVTGGVARIRFNAIEQRMKSDFPLCWSPGSTGSSCDTSIIRSSIAGGYLLTTVLFAALGTPANGTFAYCSDCDKTTPCAGSGTGALAKRLNGAWDCD